MTDNCASPSLLSVADAIGRMISALENSRSLPSADSSIELIPLESAVKRIVAQDVISNLNVPPSDNSAMDGYALRADSLSHDDTLIEVGVVYAGKPIDLTVNNGECVRIMTGAPIPSGADTVIMKEQTKTLEGNKVQFLVNKPAGNNIRKAGEDIALGNTVIQQGTRLNAANIALLASLGEANVAVFKQLTIGILATGDELMPAGQALKPGQIYESNRIALRTLLTQFGARVIDYGIIEDTVSATSEAFHKADLECDAVISSGGVSVGDADFVKQVLNSVGEVGFWKVAIKPGKPFAFGKLLNAWFCGLPGNPVSSFVTCQQLVFPFLRALQNELPVMSTTYAATLSTDIRKQVGRMDFQRGIYQVDDAGNIVVKPNGPQGSGVMSSVANANCYIVIPAEQGSLKKGTQVKIIPLEHLYN